MAPRIIMKTQGIPELIVSLRHTGERVADTARKHMHRIADRIVKEARLNAPVDKHNLEESIHKEVDYGYRGRLNISIVMGGVVNGVNVDKYVLEVHESISRMKPGPNTLAKMAANPGRKIGEKFLERALEENQDKLEKALIEGVLKEWRL